jgi:4-diphosphocytidyl-2C-methyl-D-erythritol kinase
LSGSGSAVYGIFDAAEPAQIAARKLAEAGTDALAAKTLTRQEYWRGMFEN